jgi:flagellin-like protein
LVKVRKDKNNIYAKLLKDKKGISPVITTVILVAVGIALAVAIGLWMSGLVATFTRFEKLEVTSAYATGSGPWTVKVTVKNTGSADATITSVMVNGIPTTDIGGITLTPVLPASVSVGSNQTFTISIPANQPIGNGKATSGTTLNIVLHSAAGKDYPASVTLP